MTNINIFIKIKEVSADASFIIGADILEVINTILTKLVKSIEGIENEQDMLVRLIISAALLVGLFVFKKQLAGFVIMLINKIAARKSEKAQQAIKNSLSRPLSTLIIVLALYGATEIIAPTGEIRTAALMVLKIGIILFFAWFGVNFINSDFSFFLKDDTSKSKKTAITFISNFFKAVIMVIAALLVLEQFGISATKLFAALGIGGVAVAFACKDAVENMLSGFIIIFDKPFEVDDVIEVGGKAGTVEDIKIRTTRLRNVDGSETVYPNTTMANAEIINWTKMDKRAIKETISVNYSHTADEMQKFCNGIQNLLLADEHVIADDVRVNFTEYGVHSLDIEIFFYVTAVSMPQYLKVKNDINLAIKDYADHNGMNLAFESKTIYFGDALSIKK